MVSLYHCTETTHSNRYHQPPTPTSSPLPSTTPPNNTIVDCLPPLYQHPSYPCDDDDGSSLSTTSLYSLLENTPKATSEAPSTPDHSRRPSNPARLNAEWQTLFRDALAPAVPDNNTPNGTPLTLPPPLHTASNEPIGHDFTMKAPGSFRLWDGNLNGLSAKDKHAALHDLCVSLQSRHIDAIAI
jgi:hypothetical protein